MPSSLKLKRQEHKRHPEKDGPSSGACPSDVIKRRKRGFNIPFSKWLLHGLGNELKAAVLGTDRVEARGVFNPRRESRPFSKSTSSEQADHRKPLFTLLAFDLWCDATFGEGVRIPIGDVSASADVAP